MSALERLIAAGRATTVARRTITISVVFFGAAIAWLGLPLWLGLALICDLLRDFGRTPRQARFIVTRLLVFGLGYLTCEALGILVAFAIWVAALIVRPNNGQYLGWNFRLQQLWGSTLLAIGRKAFRFRYSVTGEEVVTPGPIILLLRHSSLADTVLALAQISKPHNIILRYVLKRPLLIDPCIDIVGQRLLNQFVLKGAGTRAQVEGVARLAEDLGPNDGVLIYPEGTRFTEEKRAQQLERLKRRKRFDELEFASSLQHILPPIRPGITALLDTNQRLDNPADVLFCAHQGFEGSATLGDLLAGRLLGKTIRIHFWRVAADDIPRDSALRDDWLKEQWRIMDQTVERLDPDKKETSEERLIHSK